MARDDAVDGGEAHAGAFEFRDRMQALERLEQAAAVEGDYGRVLPQVNPGVVGLAGLEPAASS